jgi:predicted nucleotidyltransferase component of viral defense system
MIIQIRSIEPISVISEYHGIRVNLMGEIGKTRTPFSIDFGVGDSIVPTPIVRTLPVLLNGFENPTILTYSLESTLSEKLDAMIRFMEATGRMKDFYDIYYLAITFPFDGKNVQDAIFNTLSKRKTSYEKDSVQVIERLITNDAIQTRWLAFCRKVLKYDLNLNEVIMVIISFLDPPFQAMINKETFSKNWNTKTREYD